MLTIVFKDSWQLKNKQDKKSCARYAKYLKTQQINDSSLVLNLTDVELNEDIVSSLEIADIALTDIVFTLEDSTLCPVTRDGNIDGSWYSVSVDENQPVTLLQNKEKVDPITKLETHALHRSEVSAQGVSNLLKSAGADPALFYKLIKTLATTEDAPEAEVCDKKEQAPTLSSTSEEKSAKAIYLVVEHEKNDDLESLKLLLSVLEDGYNTIKKKLYETEEYKRISAR